MKVEPPKWPGLAIRDILERVKKELKWKPPSLRSEISKQLIKDIEKILVR